MPNILYLHNHTEISGGEQSLLNLWQHLDPHYKKFVILPDKGKLFVLAANFSVEPICYQMPALSLPNIFKIIRAILFLKKTIQRLNINLIHSYTPRNNFIAGIVGKLCHIPVIWHERNLLGKNEPDRSKQFLFLPNAIICNSKAVAKRFEISQRISSKVNIIFNGVNFDQFRPNEVTQKNLKNLFNIKNEKIIGTIGNLAPHKHPEEFIKIANQIIQLFPNIKFFIVGDSFPPDNGQTLLRLKLLAQKWHLENHMIFTGYQSNAADYHSLFDIFIHTGEKEACSRAILEAQACAIPVIAADDGGNAELIDNNITGFLCPKHDTDVFYHYALKLLNDDALRTKMGEAARKHIKNNFSIQKNTLKTQLLYTSLLENPHAYRN